MLKTLGDIARIYSPKRPSAVDFCSFNLLHCIELRLRHRKKRQNVFYLLLSRCRPYYLTCMNDKVYLCLFMEERPLSEAVHFELTRLTNQRM
jgi:hypothetical protein